MIEAVKFWNEPNNMSHWDFQIDKEWRTYSDMVKLAARAVKAEKPEIIRVLGGISPIDPLFIRRLNGFGTLADLNAIAVHGFPLDWNHWHINEWPDKIAEIEAVTDLPVWITEVGISTYGAEEIQEFGLRRTADLLLGRVARIHWYTLFDLPKTWAAISRHREAEGASYYRHFYMGLLHEDGIPKLALKQFYDYTPEMGICQWFRFEDYRLEGAVDWLKKLGVKRLRTGLNWADYVRPGGLNWFDRMMKALDTFDLTITFCFTPDAKGIQPHHTSPPQHIEEYADFCAAMIHRYA
jgi:beta-xylosidase